MTPRERVNMALNFKEPDRVPIDFGGTVETSLTVDCYKQLADYVGVDVEYAKIYDQFQMLPRIEGPMLNWLKSDVIQLENPIVRWGVANKDWKPWQTTRGNKILIPDSFNPVEEEDGFYFRDSKGKILATMAKTSLYFDRYNVNEFKGHTVYTDPQKWKNSLPLFSQEELETLRRQARVLYEETDYAICGGYSRGSLYSNEVWAGNSITDWLCALLTDTEYVKEITAATADRAIENLKVYLEAVGDYLDAVVISTSDYGTQKAELFSEGIFKEIYAPQYKRINDYVHQNSRAKTFFHSCGSIPNLIEPFIDCGVDILNPVQTQAEGMDAAVLKERFGERIVFWGGGADTQSVLPFGTPEEVYDHVKEKVRIFSPNGGFIFNTIHNVQYGVPPQNFEAMLKSVLENGVYG